MKIRAALARIVVTCGGTQTMKKTVSDSVSCIMESRTDAAVIAVPEERGMNKLNSYIHPQIILMLAMIFCIIPGCASSERIQAVNTTVEIEREAMNNRAEGQLEASSAIYRQLIEMNPMSFDIVRYQHAILLNAEAQSDINLIAREILNTLWILEKAETEHLEGMTKKSLQEEINWFRQFLNKTAHTYAELFDDYSFLNEQYYYLSELCLAILKYKFETDPDDDLYYILRIIVNNDDNYLRTPEFYDRFFDIYDRGMIKDEPFSPLDFLKIDVMENDLEPLDSFAEFLWASGFCQINPFYMDIRKMIVCNYNARWKLIHRIYVCRVPSELIKSFQEERQNIPMPECYQKTIQSLERFISIDDSLMNLYLLGNMYYDYNHFDKAEQIFWQVINEFSSDKYPEVNGDDIINVADSIIGIVYSIYNSKNYDRLKYALEKLKQNKSLIEKFGSHSISSRHGGLSDFIAKYEEVIRICEDNNQKQWDNDEQCYIQLDPSKSRSSVIHYNFTTDERLNINL